MSKTIVGRRLTLGNATDHLISNGINISQPCADVTITISAEGATVANQRNITIQLKDSRGKAIDYSEEVEIGLFADSGGLDYVATGGSTGIAAGASGKILALVAKKRFLAKSTAAGLIEVIYTDTGTDVGFLGVKLPGGRLVMGGAVTNA